MYIDVPVHGLSFLYDIRMYASVEKFEKVASSTAVHSALHLTAQDATKNPLKENAPSDQPDLDMFVDPEMVRVVAPTRRRPRGTVPGK